MDEQMFNGRTLRLLSALGVVLVVLLLLSYHELASETPYITSALRHVPRPTKTPESAAENTPKTATISTTTSSTAPLTQPTTENVAEEATTTPDTTPTQTPAETQATASPTLDAGDPDLLKNATAYVKAIMDPDDSTFDRLECPRSDSKRYDYLKLPSSSPSKPKYFFALDFKQKVALLPRLMGSIVETMRFLGPKYCVLSVVEGHSTDGSFEVLKVLQAEIEALGAAYHFQRSDIDPSKNGDRIGGLAELRNLAIERLVDNPAAFAPNTTVIFLNDVAICSEDILELVHQKQNLGADMTCGFDWTYVGRDPTFYDVWVARTIHGDSFFEIPPDGNWNSAWNLFWNAPDDQAHLRKHEPFQVFSCWNGAAVFSAKPLWDAGIRFRRSQEGECFQGEPQLFCKDLWHAGYGKIAVVPAVNLEYDDEKGKMIKAAKGYTSQWVSEGGDDERVLEWLDPPEKVKCMASYENQEWRPWDETLPGVEAR
ncbi:related to alpha-1,3-mannosyltransferase [Cephalotrichum gorgonifer]|uniref:Related to alpha-1,3-mannosyltransferase n=1 Tax=Cephalotrichum gorgonifer TaxID=2041049 RepID=A0AAE8N3Y5_9PEZI|nr:related to alpha-1,3-mannosyltransferase [Cephalotrichum gorgonifer]